VVMDTPSGKASENRLSLVGSGTSTRTDAIVLKPYP